MGRNRMTCIGLGVLLCAAPGCIRPWDGPGDVKRELSRSAGVRLERDFGLTVTRSGMMLARWGLKIAGENEISLKGVRRVEVGVYTVDGPRAGRTVSRRVEPPRLEGWEQVLKMQDAGENVYVLARLVDDDVRNLLVVVAEPDEWVIVRISGRLTRVFEDAVRMAFDEAHRPELYDRADWEPEWRERYPEKDQAEPAPLEASASLLD